MLILNYSLGNTNIIKNFNKNKNYTFKETYYIQKYDNDHHIYFSSITRRVFLVDDEVHKLIEKKDFNILNLKLKEEFVKQGIVVESNYETIAPKKHIKKDWRDTDYLGVFLTTGCNLRCVYCYAEGGERSMNIDFDFVKYTFEEIIKKYPKQKLHISFHGGGEPLFEFKKLKELVEYFKSKHEFCIFNVQSNLVHSKKVLDYCFLNSIEISASIDGAPIVQDKQRILPGGFPSSKIVEKNYKEIVKQRKTNYARSTTTQYVIDYMKENYYYLTRIGSKHMHFEPMFVTGRANQNPGKPWNSEPNREQYNEEIIKYSQIGEYFNEIIKTTEIPFDMYGPTFCGAGGGPMLNLATDGYLTACHESPTKEGGVKPFIWGKFNKEKREIEVYEDRLKNLQNRDAYYIEKCQNCFLRWQCSGDCLIKVYRLTGDLYKPDDTRCENKKEISKMYLKHIVDSKILKKTPYISKEIEKVGSKDNNISNINYHLNFTHNKEELKIYKNPENIESTSIINIKSSNIDIWTQIITNQLKEDNIFPYILLLNLDIDYNSKETYKNKVIELLKILKEENVHYKILNPMPICIFDEKELKEYNFNSVVSKEFNSIKLSNNQWKLINNQIIEDSPFVKNLSPNKIEEDEFCKYCKLNIEGKCGFKKFDYIKFLEDA